MPTIDFAAIGGIIADLAVNILSYAGIAALLYSIGGILIRTVSWTFDKVLVSFIGVIYKYFEMIIDGTLLTDSVVSGMMNRVYLLVGVFVAFRLGMLLFNYILNPSEVMDEKLGVNSLIKRVILGLVLIIFMPNIFGFAFRLQKAILDDQVIERIIMPEEHIEKVVEYKGKHGMGKIIGMTVFNGFFSLSADGKSNSNVETKYSKATSIDKTYDLSEIDSLGSGLDSGILYEVNDEYAFDYFPIFSTVVLCYVLYMLVQYCLDAVVRSLKLSVLQVIAPVVIVEYMINSDRNEVFKSWRKAVISTFAMLFMRVASIWFVAYVTMLMQPGMTDNTSLLQTNDSLLKAVIVLGLLAFMMDFPKMMSDVFGLDLDQSGSVKSVMGKAMGAATAGLALGGAAVGAMAKPAKAMTRAGLTGVGNASKSIGSSIASSKAGNFVGSKAKQAASAIGSSASKLGGKIAGTKFGQGVGKLGKKISAGAEKVSNSGVGRWASATGKELKKAGTAGISSAHQVAKEEHLGAALKSGALAMGTAILASNAVTKSAASGYQQASGAVSGEMSKIKQQEQQEATNRMQASMAGDLSNLSKQMDESVSNLNTKATVDLAARLVATDSSITSQPQLAQAIVNYQYESTGKNSVAPMSGALVTEAGGADKEITTTKDAQRVVETTLKSEGFSEATITHVNQIIEDRYTGASNGGTPDRLHATATEAEGIIKMAYEFENMPQAEAAAALVPISAGSAGSSTTVINNNVTADSSSTPVINIQSGGEKLSGKDSGSTITNITNNNVNNTTTSNTVSGVSVSSLNSNGERTTAGGIVLPGDVKLDNKN